jgi:hypothetical protein
MAQRTLPHFDRHLREVYRTRRRFRVALAGLFAVAFVLMGLQLAVSDAATSYTVTGKVYNASSGAGISNVMLTLCQTPSGSVYFVTNSSGVWTASLPFEFRFCVRYYSGKPSNMSAPVAVNNQPEHASQASYEYQIAGYNCYHNTNHSACDTNNQSWDRTVDIGYDFKSLPLATPTPSPTPTPVPTATPVPTPKPTPKPSPTPKPAPAAPTPTPTPAAPADTTPPTVPANFQATIAGGNAVVSLSWDASSDAGGIKGYVLERSLEQQTWQKLADNVTALTYSDKTAGFGIHYYYRLQAVDQTGNSSAYATADAATPDFTANASTTDSTTYTSDDSVATVTVPNGAVAESADCSITVTTLAGDAHKPGGADQLLVVGPYSLVCKTIDGGVIGDFQKPLSWSFNVQNKLRGLNGPSAYLYSISGPGDLVKGSQYDSKNHSVKVDTTSNQPIMVLAYVDHGLSGNFIAILVIAVLAIAGVAVLMVRRKQKTSYDDYLRAKYYNL